MTHKYILTYADVALRCKVTRALTTKKANEVTFLLETIYKKGGVFKCAMVFQCDNASKFKSKLTKFLVKHNAGIQRAARKQHSHTAFVKAFNKLKKFR